MGKSLNLQIVDNYLWEASAPDNFCPGFIFHCMLRIACNGRYKFGRGTCYKREKKFFFEGENYVAYRAFQNKGINDVPGDAEYPGLCMLCKC